MSVTPVALPAEPSEAAARLRALSLTQPVLVFKKSPICPVSHHAEAQLRQWIAALPQGLEVFVAEIDVIAERTLARGLTAALDVRHESPQALWFAAGALAWHGSHDRLTVERFDSLLAGGCHE
ncbi:MAG: monothiol bacilliredoxin BrxC family protein [Planctomycetota bacterium]